jgi:2-polyprenyl-3-methyl-5-hydroxy-6-metoxy-1,4-benzoquinol methylase
MFLSRRATQAEYFDSARPMTEIAGFYRALSLFNRFFVFAEPFQRFLPRLLQISDLRALTILDLGAGDGSLGRALTRWAARKGWQWRVTNLDFNFMALTLNPHEANVTGSVLALPFTNQSFDVVIASQMSHHLNDCDVVQHMREAWRVARRAIVLSDLHRNALLYCTLGCMLRLFRCPPPFRQDALLSVKRAWRVPELRTFATQAEIEPCTVCLYFGARVILHASKQRLSNS